MIRRPVRCCGHAVRVPVLTLPPRPAGAPGGTEFAREIRALDLEAREERVYAEIINGNVPAFLRTLAQVEMTRETADREHLVTFWVIPDYLSVGSDDDYFLVPLSPPTAQRIADTVGASLPTAPMVDAIWAAASVRLDPSPIPPGPEMTTVQVFEDHNRQVRSQLSSRDAPAGAIVAGHKKDVVLTAELANPTRQGRDLRLASSRRSTDPAALHGTQRPLGRLQPWHPSRRSYRAHRRN